MEDQIRVGRDESLLSFAVGQVGWNVQSTFAAFFHAHQALVPALYDSAGTDDELEGATMIVRRVEFGAVFKKACVVASEQSAFDGGFACSHLCVGDLEFLHV